ncbi:hypothetical protein A6R68_05418, partial [Neotoma lepida]
MKKMEDVTIQLQSITYEQIELSGILASYTNKDLSNTQVLIISLPSLTVLDSAPKMVNETLTMRTQTSNEQEQERLDERLKDPLKQKELSPSKGTWQCLQDEHRTAEETPETLSTAN